VWSSLSSRLSKNSPKCVIIESLDGGAFTNNWSHIIPSEGASGKKKQRIKNGWPTAEESVRYLTEKKRRKKANMYLTHVLAERERERERERECVCVLLWGIIPPFPPSFLKRLKSPNDYYKGTTSHLLQRQLIIRQKLTPVIQNYPFYLSISNLMGYLTIIFFPPNFLCVSDD